MNDSTSGLTVPDLLTLRVIAGGEGTVMNLDGAATITYTDWDQQSNAVARGLLARGLARGQVVALFFGDMDWISYIVAYMSVLKAGGTAIHLNNTMPPQEARRRLDQCAARGIIRGAALTAPHQPGAWTASVAELDTGDTSALSLGIGPDDISDILYSSGTTQLSKGVRVPHGNLTFGKGPEGFRQLGDPRPLITPMQVGTTASVTTTNVALTSQATLIVAPPGDVERMGQLIAEFGVGSVMINPMIGARMVAARVGDRHDLRSVHTLGTAAAPMPPAVANRLLAMFPNAQMKTAYTEISAVPGVIVSTYDPDRPLCIGRPSPSTEMMITDEAGRPVADGELGEIWLRGSAPRRRPIDPQHETGDGWTHTHDLGRLEPDGSLRLFDRRSDAIRTGGELVSTIEVEAVVYEHPSVREAAVLGIPGADGGQEVALAVALTSEADLPDVQAFLTGRLRPSQRPTRFMLLDALPFSANGKVRKMELREQFSQLAPV